MTLTACGGFLSGEDEAEALERRAVGLLQARRGQVRLHVVTVGVQRLADRLVGHVGGGLEVVEFTTSGRDDVRPRLQEDAGLAVDGDDRVLDQARQCAGLHEPVVGEPAVLQALLPRARCRPYP